MGLPLAVTGTTTDNLNYFGQRGTDANGDTMLAPFPVETLFGGAEGDKDVKRIAKIIVDNYLSIERAG